MLQKGKYYGCFIALILCSHLLYAQLPIVQEVVEADVTHHTFEPVVVGEITIIGNKKTKNAIILRELPFKKGEEYSLEELVKKFEIARRQLMNTVLFNSVIVAAQNVEKTLPAGQAGSMDVLVEVKERWYLFPVPYFKPVDRNLNQWIVEQKASLTRVNYGVKLYYNNATGNNDKLKLHLINGYTRQLSLSYDRLYIDKNLKWGMKFFFASGKNREANYNTINNKQVFLKDENNYIRKFTNAGAELTYRKAINTRHSLGVGYNTEQVNDTIVSLNPLFYNAGINSIRFPGIYYALNYFNVDYIPYPTKGFAAQVSISKSGFTKAISIWQLYAKATVSWPLSTKTFFNLNGYGGIKLPFKQPYTNLRFLGYGDTFMQGYEYYVIDGVVGGYLKTTFTRELLNFTIKIPATKKGKEAQRIPFRIFGKMYGNTGYVHNPQPGDNSLSNKMLYSGGFGIDILTFYDVTFKLEYTFNSLGENGLFLHRKTTF